MPKPDTTPRTPDDFSQYLATQEPLLLVGGQAVNLWALYYDEVTIDLAPFVSRDIDILGKRETLKEIAQLAGLKPNYFKLKPPSNEVGYIMPSDTNDTPMLIEVLRWVNGATMEELEANAVTFKIGEQDIAVRVPAPIVLLQAKLSNVATIKQDGRQDRKLIQILHRVIPEYLKDYAQLVHEGTKTERALVNVLHTLLAIMQPTKTKQIFEECGLSRTVLFNSMGTANLTKVNAFMQHQLPRLK